MKPRNWKQQDALVLDMPVTPLCMADSRNWYTSTVTICSNVPHLVQGTDDDNTKQTQTLVMICEQYPPEAWTNVYTDSCTTYAIQESGAGIAIYLPSGSTETASAAPRRHAATTKQIQRHWLWPSLFELFVYKTTWNRFQQTSRVIFKVWTKLPFTKLPSSIFTVYQYNVLQLFHVQSCLL